MNTVYLGLGANLQNRLAYLNQAIEMLDTDDAITITGLSWIYETDPVGGDMQDRYLNAVAVIETSLTADNLLRLTKQIEYDLGRRRKGERAARFIDIDILIYGDLIIQTPELTLPHPLLAERWFVLVPLVDINPDLIPPGFQKTTRQLLSHLGPPQGIDRLEHPTPWSKYRHLTPA